jgi:hypothetical protein
MDMLRNASLVARLLLALAFVPLVMAVVYAVRPTERHLALMRPLSLAGLFAALSGTVLGLINALMPLWRQGFVPDAYKIIAVGVAESLVSAFVGFACLTAAWLLVAVGLGRSSDGA